MSELKRMRELAGIVESYGSIDTFEFDYWIQDHEHESGVRKTLKKHGYNSVGDLDRMKSQAMFALSDAMEQYGWSP